MVDKTRFSAKLLKHEEAQNEAALERIAIAKKRILSILDKETVAHQKTLEVKIATQGPNPVRVDPHLIGLAIMDMEELNRLRKIVHDASNTKNWCSNIGTPTEKVASRLDELGPLYSAVSGGGFGNLTGDALEVVVFKCIDALAKTNRRFQYQGFFHLGKPKVDGRYQKIQPPKAVGGNTSAKEADFIIFGFDEGPICVECKNFREWLYPSDQKIRDLIIKSYELGCVPLIIDRRIHYTTLTNLFKPAGIMAHETYIQYYPADQVDIAAKVNHKRMLGFTDVIATEDPHPRTFKFFHEQLPKIIPQMAARWDKNRDHLYAYAKGDIHLAQLYNRINSPAGGKWQDKS